MLLVFVAIAHFALVQTVGASRWRVGGMGMYSEPHPNARDVSFTRGDEEIRGRKIDSKCVGGEDLLRQAVTHPTDANLRNFAVACLADDPTGWRAAVVVPRLDPESRELTIETIREVQW